MTTEEKEIKSGKAGRIYSINRDKLREAIKALRDETDRLEKMLNDSEVNP